jgi:mono/diheme cytochrome c family protein
LVRRYRCLSCHEIRGFGGTLSTVPLDRIASQLQRDYLEAYLLNPGAVRVSVEERMPHFHMTSAEAEALAEFLAVTFVDDSLEVPVAMDREAARQGQQLFERLGCRACHILGGQGGYVGPDLSESGRRLKPGWTQAFLLAPEKWKPGTLQPDYGFKSEEARVLTAYLMTLGTSAGERRK